jgi:predicted nucleic acid-binding protein
MPAKRFLDTNILLYAYDRDAGVKREKAAALVCTIGFASRIPSPQLLQVRE